MSLSCW